MKVFDDWPHLHDRLGNVGVSLERFADLVPCHINTLYLWRSGKVNPTPENSHRVGELLERIERRRLQKLLERYPDEVMA